MFCLIFIWRPNPIFSAYQNYPSVQTQISFKKINTAASIFCLVGVIFFAQGLHYKIA